MILYSRPQEGSATALVQHFLNKMEIFVHKPLLDNTQFTVMYCLTQMQQIANLTTLMDLIYFEHCTANTQNQAVESRG